MALVQVVLGAGIFAIFYRHNADIVISARFWSWNARITYTTYDCRPNTTCDGKGHCTTMISCTTNTHTRCAANRRGMDLPPVAPDLPCVMLGSDRRADAIAYFVTYTFLDSDQVATRQFAADLWPNMTPGSRRHVVLNVFGTVMALADE